MNKLRTASITLFVVLIVLSNIEAAWAQPQEATFNFTGAQQSFVVPQGVTNIHIEAWGAQGGSIPPLPIPVPGGLGGFAEGDLAVVPGQTLEIFVGGQGLTVSVYVVSGGGFNGGGDTQAFPAGMRANPQGGGGGASDVRVGGTALTDRVIVAGGGGGAGALGLSPGGLGGGLVGGDGNGDFPGLGGTQLAGGAGYNSPATCPDGGFGIGASTTATTSCVGGGGGWYGGGAGISAGGGSSYIDGVANGMTTSGLREGDGLVVLTYSLPTLGLSPSTATNEVLTDHTVTAAFNIDDVPQEGILVDFEVISGPNMGEMSDPGSGECTPNNDCTTDVNGEVSWTYTSMLSGTDNIVASIADPDIESNTVESIWLAQLILNQITPALASNLNQISAEEATPDGDVVFIWGFQPGSVIIGGSACNGLQLDIKKPRILSTVTAGADQFADYTFFIPNIGDFELAILTQAVDIPTCRKSEVVTNIISKD